MQALRAEFPHALFNCCYEETRLSVILPDGKCLTTRPPLNLDRTSEPIRASLSTVAWTVVAPFGADDTPFVEDILRIATRSVLMLSKDQMCNRESALRLMKAATRVVLNHEEAEAVTGHKDVRLAIDTLLAAGCREVLVTSPDGVEAYLDGQPESRQALAVDRVKGTVGAGDAFIGVAVMAWAAGYPSAEGLDLGLAAAARHVAQLPPLASLTELAAWAVSQPRVSPPDSPKLPTKISQPFRVRHVVAMGISVGLACTWLWLN